MYNADKPITTFSQDRLKRSSFSKQLAKAIMTYNSNDNFTISLTGKWGCGKSSILNMTKQEMEVLSSGKPDAQKPIIVEFNPWNYSNQDHLISQFFKTIQISLENSENSINLQKLSFAIEQYAIAIQFAIASNTNETVLFQLGTLVISSCWKILKNLQSKSPDLNEKKEIIIKLLREQQQKIVIIIDDIDRLNNKQIRLIFQLVNSVAGFPNMIYLLSFDKTVVARALEEEQNCNGEEYLEKIIQVPFEVPPINRTELLNIFNNRLSSIVEDKFYDNLQREYWYNMADSCVYPFVNSIRDVNRILNAYEFKYSFLHEETNFADLLAITTLQVQLPKVYAWIANNKLYFAGIPTSTTDEQKDKTLKEYMDLWETLYSGYQHKILESLKVLFPKIAILTGKSYLAALDAEDEFRYLQKIASEERFDLYFNLSLENVTFSKDYIKRTLHDLDAESLSKQMDLLTDAGTLNEFLLELKGYIKELHKDKIYLFINEMIRLQTIPKNYQSYDLFTVRPSQRCHACAILLLRKLDQYEQYELLSTLINNASCHTLPVIGNILKVIEISIGKIHSSTYINTKTLIIETEYVAELERAYLAKMKSIYSEVNILEDPKFTVLNTLWVFLDKESFITNIKELLKTPINTPKFLFHETMNWNSDDEWGYSFDEGDFSTFISKEDAYKNICSLINTSEFDTLLYDFKKAAAAFYLWYNLNGKDTRGVADKAVKNLLSEWEK